MAQCPQCSKTLSELTPRCPTCQADLTLLVDYVSHLQGGLQRAENLTRAGELGQAVWAYLEVLEADPDNPAARRQVSQVATAVRQFDTSAPGRRWAQGLDPFPKPDWLPSWAKVTVLALLFVVVFAIGYFLGGPDGAGSPSEQSAPVRPTNTMSGK